MTRLAHAILRSWESWYCPRCGWWYPTKHQH